MKLLFSVLLATSAASKLTTHEADVSDRRLFCDGFACPALWTAKMDIHTLQGNSKEECCLQTCGFFFNETEGCSAGYVGNDAYIKNTVESEESATLTCCDKQCQNKWTCPDNHAPVPALSAGNSAEECCKPTCKAFECKGPWAANEAVNLQIGNSNETCCLPACSEYQHCERETGWTRWDDKNRTAGSTHKECCLPLCSNTGQIQCSLGWYPPPERDDWSNGSFFNKTAGEESPCCKKTCRAHLCSSGWVRHSNDSLLAEWGDTDEDCCEPTCGNFSCDVEAGWASDTTKLPLLLNDTDVGALPEKCCQKTCKQFDCPNELWMTPSTNLSENLTGFNDSICCSPACSQHTCQFGMVLIPDSNSTLGADDDICCESNQCPPFRNGSLKTQITPASDKSLKHCNEIENQTECEMAYYVWKIAVNVTNQNGTTELRDEDDIVSCSYDAQYKLCRFNETSALPGCKGFASE